VNTAIPQGLRARRAHNELAALRRLVSTNTGRLSGLKPRVRAGRLASVQVGLRVRTATRRDDRIVLERLNLQVLLVLDERWPHQAPQPFVVSTAPLFVPGVLTPDGTVGDLLSRLALLGATTPVAGQAPAPLCLHKKTDWRPRTHGLAWLVARAWDVLRLSESVLNHVDDAWNPAAARHWARPANRGDLPSHGPLSLDDAAPSAPRWVVERRK